MHLHIYLNKKKLQKITLTFLLSLHGFSIQGMETDHSTTNQELSVKPAKRAKALASKKNPNFSARQHTLHSRHYYGLIEAFTLYNPEQRYSNTETVIYHPDKNAFFVYDENLNSTYITDEITNKLLALKICLQVDKTSYEKLNPAYNFYIKNIFENFLFDEPRYKTNQEINKALGKNILGKDLINTIKNTVIKAIKDNNFWPNTRIQFDFLTCGTTQWYIDHEEKIVVSTWGETECKDDLLKLIDEHNPHILSFLKRVTNSIPKDYCYLIGINNRKFTITPDTYNAFKQNGMSIRKDKGYLLSNNPANNYTGLFKSLSIKALINT